MPPGSSSASTPAASSMRAGGVWGSWTGGARPASASAKRVARLDAEARHMRALSPQHVLERGYAVVRRADGQVVRRAGQVSPGDVIGLRLAAGRLTAVVRGQDDG